MFSMLAIKIVFVDLLTKLHNSFMKIAIDHLGYKVPNHS